MFLGNEILLNKIKFSKLIKYGKLNLLKNPKAIFKRNRTIEFHFNMFHGEDLLRLAIEKLEEKEKNDFLKFVTIKLF